MKEREFLSLKQGNLNVVEYATKFNELSRFSPHQITTEEKKMDHFKQGLRGDIRSMIAGQNFDNFHDMYQRAVKMARVLEESKRESQALALGKQKIEPYRKGFLGNKRFRPDNYQGKGKQPVEWQTYLQCKTCGRHHMGARNFEVRYFGCGEPYKERLPESYLE